MTSHTPPIAERLRALRSITDFISLRAELLAIAEELERIAGEMRDSDVVESLDTWADALAEVEKCR